MQETFIKEYVKEQKAMSRRINEQSIINMMKVDRECVSLTPRAKNFLKFSKIVKQLYGI